MNATITGSRHHIPEGGEVQNIFRCLLNSAMGASQKGFTMISV